MRIGIDARFLTHPQSGGFKTYTQNLLTAIGQIDPVNEYVIYIDRSPTGQMLPKADNFCYRVVNSTLPGIGMPVREQITLPRCIAGDHLDLVHFLCNTAPLRVSTPYVVTLHDTIQVTTTNKAQLNRSLAEQKRWAIMAYSKWTILSSVRKARRIITVSHYEKQQIAQQLSISPERICVTHLSASPVFMKVTASVRKEWQEALRQRWGVQGSYILGIGYEPRKNIPLLINAFALLAPHHPLLNLVIVAAHEGSRFAFQQLVNQHQLTNRVCILGSVTAADLAPLYNLACAFAFPSERESFGLPPLEALACGAPTVAMQMSSLPEILGDGALFVPTPEASAWAIALDQIISDEQLRNDLIHKGLHRATELSWQRCAKETIEIYQKAVT